MSENYLIEFQKIDILELLQTEKILGNDNFSEKFINKYIKENILDINPELLS